MKFIEGKPLDRLVCNAAVYQPTLSEAKWTEDGFEQQLQTNHLSHFLLCSLLIPVLRTAEKARVIMVGNVHMRKNLCNFYTLILNFKTCSDIFCVRQVGSVTGNDNTVGGGGVYPIADLKDLKGLENGILLCTR